MLSMQIACYFVCVYVMIICIIFWIFNKIKGKRSKILLGKNTCSLLINVICLKSKCMYINISIICFFFVYNSEKLCMKLHTYFNTFTNIYIPGLTYNFQATAAFLFYILFLFLVFLLFFLAISQIWNILCKFVANFL